MHPLLWMLLGAWPVIGFLLVYRQGINAEIRKIDEARKAAKALAIKALDECVIYRRFYDLVQERHGNADVLLGDARDILATEKQRRIEG